MEASSPSPPIATKSTSVTGLRPSPHPHPAPPLLLMLALTMVSIEAAPHAVILCVDYTLAGAHEQGKYPCALDECLEVYRWAVSNPQAAWPHPQPEAITINLTSGRRVGGGPCRCCGGLRRKALNPPLPALTPTKGVTSGRHSPSGVSPRPRPRPRDPHPFTRIFTLVLLSSRSGRPRGSLMPCSSSTLCSPSPSLRAPVGYAPRP